MSAVTCVLHHHIGPESAFERGLGISSTRERYDAQIRRLALDYDVIDLETLLSGNLPRRALLLTFDDAFRSVLDAARDTLAPLGLPSVFFVNPGLLGEDRVSLDSALAWAVDRAGLERVCEAAGVRRCETLAALVTGEMATLGAGERLAIKARVLEAFGPPDLAARAAVLREEDIAAFRDLRVEIGNHTMTHVHCRSLTKEECAEEIVGAKERLEALSGARVRAFSVPYGHERDLTSETLALLRASGHEAIFLVHARSNDRRPAPDVWYRTSLHDETPDQLRWHLRWKPALRTLKRRLPV